MSKDFYGLYRSLLRCAEKHSNKILLADDKTTHTCGETLEESEAAAARLYALGVRKDMWVALRASLRPRTVIYAAALDALGARVVMAGTHTPVADFLRDGNITFVDRILTESEGRDVLENPDGSFIGETDTAEKASFEIAESDDREAFIAVFTAGSTGDRRAVVLSRYALMAHPEDAEKLFGEDGNDVAAAVMPLNHVLGIATVTNALHAGHTLFFPSSSDPEAMLGYIEKYRISLIFAVPTFFLSLLEKRKNYDISSLRAAMIAGGPCTREQMIRLEKELGMCMIPSYGMSECMGVTAMSVNDALEDRACGVGRVSPMAEAYISGENGEKLGVGEQGEIFVRGKPLMLGYLGDPENTAQTIKDGWLRTGDIGYFDEKGILHLCGRKKDIIIRGGENIAAVTIEKALLDVRGVYQACAVGIPDEKYGEVPAAMVVTETGIDMTCEEIVEAVREKLKKHELPEVYVARALPLTTAGKTDKRAVKEMLLCLRA